jgi:hypothetical protein
MLRTMHRYCSAMSSSDAELNGKKSPFHCGQCSE